MPSALIAFLAAAAVSLFVSLAAMVLALREPGLSLKPVWALLSLVGIGGGAMVWSMPDQIYWFFGIALPTASFVAEQGSWQPTLVRFLFPVGSVLVLLRLYWHRRSRSTGAIRT
jgi:hypothetical protein